MSVRLRLALRRLSRAPLFSLGVVAMLALTLTAVTLVMSVLYAAKVRPLPIAAPGSLIAIWQNDDIRSDTPLQDVVPGDVVEAWRARQTAFSDITAFYSRRTRVTDKQVRAIDATIVDGHYFTTLGLQPMLGRVILPTDAADGATPVAVLSEAAWRLDHGADPAIVGTIMELDHQAYTIVGILSATANVFGTPLWISAPGQAAWPTEGSYYLIGRLRPGHAMARAQMELATLMPRVAAPAADAPHTGVWLVPLAESLRGVSGTAILFIAATLLLALVAIANIGTLFLVRVLGSLRQAAISTAIGATAGRLRADAALESGILAAFAGVIALGGAAWLRTALQSFISGMVTSTSELLPLPWPLLAVAMIVAIGTGIAIALGAQATTRRLDIASYLHGAGAGATRQQSRWRLLLVGLQVTVALITCVAAARLIASARYVSHINVGFETDHLVVGQIPVWTSPAGTDDGAEQLVARLAPGITNTPGLGEPAIWATIGFRMPKDANDNAIAIDGTNENFSVHCHWSTCPTGVHPISDNLFAVLGIPLRRGRVFGAVDHGGPPVAVVNEQAQHAWFHDADPIGRRIQIRGSDSVEEWRTIVGVVANSSQLNEMGRVPKMYDASAVQPLIYEPLSQARLHQAGLFMAPPLTVALRPRLPVGRAIPAMRTVLASQLPDVDPSTVSTMTAIYDGGFGGTRLRLYTAVVTAVASITLLLAIVGIGGVVAESARSRTRELGIRLALGSSQRGVIMVVCHGAARLLAIGVAAGVVLSLTLAKTMARIAFGGAPNARPRGVLLTGPDVSTPTLLIASATILIVGLIAAGLPAIRASQLDPMAVLRADAE